MPYGLRMQGTGTMWVRNLLLGEVGADVPGRSIGASCARTNAEARRAWEAVQQGKSSGRETVLPSPKEPMRCCMRLADPIHVQRGGLRTDLLTACSCTDRC